MILFKKRKERKKERKERGVGGGGGGGEKTSGLHVGIYVPVCI